MNLLINGLGADTGGAARHLHHFLVALRRNQSQTNVWLMCRENVWGLDGGDKTQFVFINRSLASGTLPRLLIDNLFISRLVKKHQIDCIVSLTNFGSWFHSVPHILFQRNALYYSDWYKTNISGKTKIENQMRSWFSFELMKRANVVVTPSIAMKEMILNCYPSLNADKFRVLMHGHDVSVNAPPLPHSLQKQITGTHQKIFYPSLPAFHKGIFMIFNIARELKKRGVSFKIYLCFSETEARRYFGPAPLPNDWNSLCQNMVFLGQLTREQIDSFTPQMDLMLNTSFCESFGFPLLEAMGANLVCVCADTPINREICGAASLYYPPMDPIRGADAIGEAQKSEIRQELKTLAKQRMSQFDWSWDRYLNEFLKIVRTTL